MYSLVCASQSSLRSVCALHRCHCAFTKFASSRYVCKFIFNPIYYAKTEKVWFSLRNGCTFCATVRNDSLATSDTGWISTAHGFIYTGWILCAPLFAVQTHFPVICNTPQCARTHTEVIVSDFEVFFALWRQSTLHNLWHIKAPGVFSSTK